MNPLKDLLLPGERVIAVVGAGGKTTFIDTLAGQLSGWGARVLVTTTTKMLPPSRNLLLLDPNPDTAPGEEPDKRPGYSPGSATAPEAGQPAIDLGRVRVPPYRRLTVGRAVDPRSGKLLGVSPELIPALMGHFRADYVLVEADGARGLPVKAPAAHEPVVPACADLVVGVVGLDCLGRPADEENAFRLEEFLAVADIRRGEAVTPECLARLAAHPEGLFKGAPARARRLAFHNKAESWPRTGEIFGSARQGWFIKAG